MIDIYMNGAEVHAETPEEEREAALILNAALSGKTTPAGGCICPDQRDSTVGKGITMRFCDGTDAQITINQEDFAAAQKFPLRGKAYYVPGIGVDVKKISSVQVDRATKRAELGIPQDAFVFISVGELNENKNHATVVRALAKADIPNSYYLICGEGKLKQQHFELAQKLGISEKVKLLGFRTDVSEILRACDCFVFPSSREGLSVSLMEAMAAGLPCIASRIRGNVDLLENSRYLFEPADENALCQLLKDAANGVQIEQECELNWETLKKYDIKNVSKEMQSIYSAVIEGTTTNESFTSIKK